MTPHKFLSILLLMFALCACNKKQAPIKEYKLDGVIVSLEPSGHIAKINAQEIKGYMEAMTMEYPVKDAVEFDKLHAGDHIAATVYVQDLNYWVGDIHQVR